MITILLVIIGAGLLVLAGCVLAIARGHAAETAQFDHDLDAADPTLEVHHETLRDLRQEDLGPLLVGADAGMAADAPAVLDADPGVGRPVDRGSALGSSDVQAMGGASVDQVAVPVPVHLPTVRDVSGRDTAVAGASLTPAQRRRAIHKGRIPRPAAERDERVPTLAEATAQARAWVTAQHEHARQQEAREFWTGLQRITDEAYDWWAAPGRWELAA